MPAWRPRQDWLELAVSSALAQQGVDLELIVVDDGSPQPVKDQLRVFADERLHIERIEHGGYSEACNAAMGLARGRYLRFVDADDYFPPSSTARLVTLAANTPYALSYGGVLVCDDLLRPRWRMKTHYEGNVARASLLSRFNVRPGSLLWSQELVDRTGWMTADPYPSGDWDFIQRASEHAAVRGTRDVVVWYRRHKTSMTGQRVVPGAAPREIVRRYFDRHPEQIGTWLERRALAMVDASAARLHATRGEPRPAASHLARALLRDPLCLANEFRQVRSVLTGHLERRLRRRA